MSPEAVNLALRLQRELRDLAPAERLDVVRRLKSQYCAMDILAFLLAAEAELARQVEEACPECGAFPPALCSHDCSTSRYRDEVEDDYGMTTRRDRCSI